MLGAARVGLVSALALALSAAAAIATEATMVYHSNGTVLVRHGTDEWDVTGFMSLSPNISISSEGLRPCIACTSSDMDPSCAKALLPAYEYVCDPSISKSSRNARADEYLIENDPEEWCLLECDFAGMQDRIALGDGGMAAEDVHCVHIPVSSCHDKIIYDAELAHSVSAGSVKRRNVVHPLPTQGNVLGLLQSIPPGVHSGPVAPAEDGATLTEAEALAHAYEEAKRRLFWILEHRGGYQLPPSPGACDTCAFDGLDSLSCKQAIMELAREVCIDGDEVEVCGPMSGACTPFPESGGLSHMMQHRAEHDAMHAEEMREKVEGEEQEGGDSGAAEGHALHRFGAVTPLSPVCAAAVEHMCAVGVVMPGEGVRSLDAEHNDVNRDDAHQAPHFKVMPRFDGHEEL